MKLLRIILALSVACVLPGLVLGATVGKITGVVTDAQTKEPLVGVSVQVVGTNMGAVSDAEGGYTILNVPVGTYTLKMSLVGYAEVQISNVEVSADLASYQNQELSSRVTDIGKTIQVTAERPLVVKDKTTTINIVKRDELLAMPVRGFEQVVGIQNSVVRIKSNLDVRQRGQRESVGGVGQELNLRGGRPSEVAYYVDGFSQQDPLSGISTSNISNNAIKEVSVTAGAFSAEYGYVASGIVNVVTNSGTEKYKGNAEIVTDNMWGKTHSYDQNSYSADFGGPIPGTTKGFFFFSGERRWLGDREPSSITKDVIENYSLASRFGDSPQRLPSNTLDGWSYQGKLDYNFKPTLKAGLSFNGSLDKWQEYRHSRLFTPEHMPRYKDKNVGINAKVTHTLNANTYYNLSASYYLTERIRGDGVLFDNLAAYKRTGVLDRSFPNPEEDEQNLFYEDSAAIRASFYDSRILPGSPEDTIVGYQSAYWANFLHRKSSYIGFKGDLTDRVSEHHTLKAGFDFQRHTLRYFENLDATLGYTKNLVNRYGFDQNGEESDAEGYANDTKHPYNLGLYTEDRFEWQSLVVSAGVRFDYFDYKALRIKDVLNPLDPGNVTGVDTLDPGDLEPSKKFTRVSPRLGVAFPVSDATQLHINYGKFYQRPDLLRLYLGYDFFEARVSAGSYYPFASPNLAPEKTTQYEFGITHQLGEFTALDVTAYYKDVSDLTQIFHQSPSSPRVYDFFANTDYGTIKGVDFEFRMRRTRNITLNLKYTLGYSTGTGSYAQSQYIVAWQNPQFPPKTTAPLDYDQRHSIIGVFDIRSHKGEGPRLGNTFILENTGLDILVRAASGTPYTPIKVDNAITLAAFTPQPIGSINSARLPWTFRIDLKLERVISVRGYSLTPYLQVLNLLDRDNVYGVYETTGKPNETGWLGTAEGTTFVQNNGDYEYRLKQDNPSNYGIPRMILVGLRASF
ncbi:MAG: TonB-dependent receptor [Candidatus Zixiibacteriota bacterium]